MYKALIHSNSHYKQLCLSNKMEHLSYKGECGICEHTSIEAFKKSWVGLQVNGFGLLVIKLLLKN